MQGPGSSFPTAMETALRADAEDSAMAQVIGAFVVFVAALACWLGAL